VTGTISFDEKGDIKNGALTLKTIKGGKLDRTGCDPLITASLHWQACRQSPEAHCTPVRFFLPLWLRLRVCSGCVGGGALGLNGTLRIEQGMN